MGAIDLTKIRSRVNDIKKKIYYEDSIQTLKLYKINQVLATLSDGWFMGTYPVSNLALGAEYFELYIADSGKITNLGKLITQATTVAIDGEKYRVMPYYRPRTATKQWYLRVESTGERE